MPSIEAGRRRPRNRPSETLRGGWLHTGDVGSVDESGFLTLRDRSKDLIISGGTNIYPREIEEVLLRHPAVLECSIVGRLHPDWGEEVVAFVVARPGESVGPAELDRLYLDYIARFKRPKHYRFVEAQPKNNYGRVLKTEIEGIPDPKHASTSYAERQNLTMRMQMRRFTRLTNAFSKKFENHVQMVALYTVWHNFVSQHKSLKGITPVMASGVSKTLWSVEDIANLVEAAGPLRQNAGPTSPAPSQFQTETLTPTGSGCPRGAKPLS